MIKKIISLFKKKELPLYDLEPKGFKVVGKKIPYNEMGQKQIPLQRWI